MAKKNKRDDSIQKKAYTFLIIPLIFIVVAAISSIQINASNEGYENLLERRTLVIENVHILKTEAVKQENTVSHIILSGDREESEFTTSKTVFQQAFDEFSPTAPNEESKAMIDSLKEKYDIYLALLEETLEENQSSQEAALQRLMSEELKEASQVFQQQADNILEVAHGVMASDQEKAHSTLQAVNQLLIIVTVISTVLSFVIVLFIRKNNKQSI